MNKDKNGENVLCLEITEVLFVHCNIVNNNYQHDSRVLYTFNPNKSFVQLFSLKILYFSKPVIESFNRLKYGLMIKILIR